MSADLARLHALTMALVHLRPGTGERILDLGGCTAEATAWLAPLGLEWVSVACPPLATFEVGRGGPHLLADGEALPLGSEACDHAVCLDFVHRVGNRRRVLRELHRVLRTGGRAVIAAPGTAVATKISADGAATALTADALLTECVRAGFVSPHLRPLSYVVPDFEIGRGRWGVWERYAQTRRPRRSWKRIRRAVVDAFTSSRRETAFEDILGIELIRLVKTAVDRYPVVVVTKSA